MKFAIKVVRDNSEYADVEITACSEAEAKRKVLRLNADDLDFYPGIPDSDFGVLSVLPAARPKRKKAKRGKAKR